MTFGAGSALGRLSPMEKDRLVDYISTSFAGIDVMTPDEGIAAGDSFFYYDPDRILDHGKSFPFATIVTKDYGEFDCASNLNRPGVFRLNVGVSQETYRRLFGDPPRAQGEGGVLTTPDSTYDFTVLDRLLPHPVYAPQSWVCVLNPSEATLREIQPLLAEAHDRAARRYRVSAPRDAGDEGSDA